MKEEQREDKKKLKGWRHAIPHEIYILSVRGETTLLEGLIFTLIESLDHKEFHCFASNNFIARKLHISENKVSVGISNLKRLGFLKDEIASDKGRKVRTLSVDYDYITKYKELVKEFDIPIKDVVMSTDNGTVETSHTKIIKEDNKSILPSEESNFFPSEKNCSSSSEESKMANPQDSPSLRERLKMGVRRISRKAEIKVLPSPVSRRSKQVMESLWKELGLSQHREGTKLYSKSCRVVDKLMSGSFFDGSSDFREYKGRKFTYDDFALSINRFKLAALSPDYSPEQGTYKEHLKRMSLLTFLYNVKANNVRHQSLFIHYLNNEPEKLSERFTTKVNKEEPVVKVLAEGFRRLANMNGEAFTNKQWMDLSYTAKRIREVLPEYSKRIRMFNYHRMVGDFEDGESLIASYILDALEEELKSSTQTITTGWLCSEKTFEERLPNYLFKINAVYKDY